MGLIKEPKNIDLTVQSTPWTMDELALLSAIIKKAKQAKNSRTKSRLKKTSSSKKHWA